MNERWRRTKRGIRVSEATLDVRTAGLDYGSNIPQLQQCFPYEADGVGLPSTTSSRSRSSDGNIESRLLRPRSVPGDDRARCLGATRHFRPRSSKSIPPTLLPPGAGARGSNDAHHRGESANTRRGADSRLRARPDLLRNQRVQTPRARGAREYVPCGWRHFAATPSRSLLKTLHFGRPDLGVVVAGGGVIDAYEVRLSFNGTKYPEDTNGMPRVAWGDR
jgi:hypothetical protein